MKYQYDGFRDMMAGEVLALFCSGDCSDALDSTNDQDLDLAAERAENHQCARCGKTLHTPAPSWLDWVSDIGQTLGGKEDEWKTR